MSRAQSGRKRLAVPARQLAVEPRLQILRRSRRPLLCGVEQARQSALAHHVHRIAPLGAPVLINGTWYNRAFLDHKSMTEWFNKIIFEWFDLAVEARHCSDACRPATLTALKTQCPAVSTCLPLIKLPVQLLAALLGVSGNLICNPTTARKGNEVVGVCNTRSLRGENRSP